MLRSHLWILAVSLLTPAYSPAAANEWNVRDSGARGDGSTSDRAAIQKAIDAASAAGGGVVFLPAGNYISGSLQLKSHIRLEIGPGAVLRASSNPADYDSSEPNPSTKFQDFGHSHWRNSLIWGENLEDVTIGGSGLIDGSALTREAREDIGNKAIALKLCRNIIVRDVAILSAGHFGILATGVDNLSIDNVRIDTNRDGIDIDGCRNVRISNASVNSPNDDAIVLKASHALGERRATENVTITNCFVSGFDIGSLLNGTYGRNVTKAPDRDGPTGRVKIGTESEGDFRNITVSNVVFERSRGLALESVDGAQIEDVAITNVTMRDVSNSAIFLRLGSRMRAPEGTAIGSIRRVTISHVVAYAVDPRYSLIDISGIPGHPIEDLSLYDLRLVSRGGLTLNQVADQPADMVNSFFYRASGGVPKRKPFETPEREREYPEPSMFGLLPAYGLFARHARNIEFSHLNLDVLSPDKRPAVFLEDVGGATLDHFHVPKPAEGSRTFVLTNTSNFRLRASSPVEEATVSSTPHQEM